MRPVTVLEPSSWRNVRPFAALARLRMFSDLLWTLTLHRLKVRYKHTQLGFAWAILQPLALMLVFTMVVSVLGRAPGGDVPYPLFAYAALVPWTAFASGLSSAVVSLTSHSSLLTKVAFPREILPITYVAAAMVDLAVAAVPLAGLMVWYGVTPGFAVLNVVPAMAVMCTFLTGAGLLLSAVHASYRDVGAAVPVLLQIWMFLTPVLYPLSAVSAALPAPLPALYVLNPMVSVIDAFRGAVLGNAPDVAALASGAAVSIVLLVTGYLYFKWTEMTLADEV